MIGVEVHRLRLQVRPILDRLGHVHRKGAEVNGAALRTCFDFGPMVRHRDLHRGQFKHLALSVVTRTHLRQRRLTLATARARMHTDVLRVFDRFQGVAKMARLTAWRFPTRGPQIARPRFTQTVTGGWLATIAAVLGQLVFQRLYTGFQSLDHGNQLIDQSDHRFLTLLIDSMHLFGGRQIKLIHVNQYDRFSKPWQDLKSLTHLFQRIFLDLEGYRLFAGSYRQIC
jgi:hypothetical protein